MFPYRPDTGRYKAEDTKAYKGEKKSSSGIAIRFSILQMLTIKTTADIISL